MNFMLRSKPCNFVRFTAEFLKTFANVSAVISCQSFFENDSNSGFGLNNGSLCGFEIF